MYYDNERISLSFRIELLEWEIKTREKGTPCIKENCIVKYDLALDMLKKKLEELSGQKSGHEEE